MPMVVSLGYGDIVLPTEDAIQLLQILEKAERYRQKYNGSNPTTYHIWPNDTQYTGTLIGNDLYRMAKLAGKPED